jgi:glutamate/tyrosine decarboxylase-like PLP-dependent enzyme
MIKELIRYLFNSIALIILEFKPEISKEFDSYQRFALSIREEWEKLDIEFNESGLKFDSEYNSIIKIISHFLNITKKINEKLNKNIYSGMIYSSPNFNINEKESLNIENIEDLYGLIMKKTWFWNSLHPIFGTINYWMNRKIVEYVSKMYGSEKYNSHNICGIITTGGTESLNLAARMYKQKWIREHFNRNFIKNFIFTIIILYLNYVIISESILYMSSITIIFSWILFKRSTRCVIFAPKSIHISLKKAEEDFEFDLVHYENINDLRYLIYFYPNKAAVFGSYPSYALGNQDDIETIGEFCKQKKIPFHVDNCLGGFIFTERSRKFLSKSSGITSISIDTHKNGLCPKGSSLLLTKEGDKKHEKYFRYCFYSYENWEGGLYGTPKFQGSSSCVETISTFYTLLLNNINFYEKESQEIQKTTFDIKELLIIKLNATIYTLNPLNVIAFKIEGLPKYANYELASLMSKRGYCLSVLKDEILHFCITHQFLHKAIIYNFTNLNKKNDNDFINLFINEIKIVINELKSKNVESFSSESKVYCNADMALSHNLSDDKLEYIFGPTALRENIKQFTLSNLNPYLLNQ